MNTTQTEIPAAEEQDTFAMFVQERDGFRQYAFLGAQGAAYSLRESTGRIIAVNTRTGSRYGNR